jgi:filamentous hemagglutinin
MLDAIADQLASAGRGAVNLAGIINHYLSGIFPAPSGEPPPADANPLVQENNGGSTKPTGSAVVTSSAPVCIPNVGCVMAPPVARPGTLGYGG